MPHVRGVARVPIDEGTTNAAAPVLVAVGCGRPRHQGTILTPFGWSTVMSVNPCCATRRGPAWAADLMSTGLARDEETVGAREEGRASTHP
jgi:hypothetical protein